MGEHVRAGTLDMWVERQGTGPDVLLIAGLGDPAEAWQSQLDGLADRYRLTAYDNRGMGRTPLPAEPFTVATMADDAAALLRALDIPAAHVAGAFRRQRHRPGTRAQAPRARPQPDPGQHLGASGRVLPRRGEILALAARSRAQRTGLPRSVLLVDLHSAAHTRTARSTRSSRTCWPSRTSRPPRPSSAASTRSSPTTPPAWLSTHRGADARAGRGPGHDHPSALRPRRRRCHPRCPVRGPGR